VLNLYLPQNLIFEIILFVDREESRFNLVLALFFNLSGRKMFQTTQIDRVFFVKLKNVDGLNGQQLIRIAMIGPIVQAPQKPSQINRVSNDGPFGVCVRCYLVGILN